ncbi:hypothetical protein ACJZ2D_014162 [Fusarium nematophilum]
MCSRTSYPRIITSTYFKWSVPDGIRRTQLHIILRPNPPLIIAIGNNLPFQLKDQDLFHNDSYVDGAWVAAKSGKRFDIIDPDSDRVFTSCPDNGPEDVESVISSSYRAFKEFRLVNLRKRAELLLEWHRQIEQAKDDLAQILTYETGKPLTESHGELDYSLGFTWWFAGEAERIQGCITLVPWNFPVAMVLRKAGAAFAAGCTVLVKPSPETPLTCLALAHLDTRAGLPPSVLNVLTTSLKNTPSLSKRLITHSLTKKVTFTGSTRVGKIVAGLWSRNLKKCTLEMEGNCPFIVFDDADIDDAVAQFMALIILTDMNQDMVLSQEETFVPVCGIFQFETEEGATQWANEAGMGQGKFIQSSTLRL